MIREYTLDNGLRILHEPLPHLHTVAVGLWMGTGSRHEEPENGGMSHCLEHMLFKGTQHRSAAGIAREIDCLGGNINAFTSKDSTCYHTKTLSEDLPRAMDILTDMVRYPLLETAHLELEKGVILEEIGMVEDYPEELVQDVLLEKTWEGHSLSRPILGTRDSVSAFTSERVREYHNRHYVPDNAVLSVAGEVDINRVLAYAEQYLGSWAGNSTLVESETSPVFQNTFTIARKKTEQAHLCLAFPGVGMDEEDIWPLAVLNAILGGGMGSRLFQRVREELGLVYSVYSFPTSYRDGGLLSVYAAAAPKKAREVLKRLAEEIGRLASEPIPEGEFTDALHQLRRGFLMGLDSTNGHMMSMGRDAIVSRRIRQTEETLARIDAVTPAQVDAILARVFRGKAVGFAGVGSLTLPDSLLDQFRFH